MKNQQKKREKKTALTFVYQNPIKSFHPLTFEALIQAYLNDKDELEDN